MWNLRLVIIGIKLQFIITIVNVICLRLIFIDYQQGICQQCELGRFLSQNVCLFQCWDGNYVKSVESCDDGNFQNGDGCDCNCKMWKVASLFVFIQNNYNSNLLFFLIILANFKKFQSIFDQKMKYQQNDDEKLSLLILSEIINFENTKQIRIRKQRDITIPLYVNFYAPIERPILKISFLDDLIVSEYDISLKGSVKTTQLLSAGVLSQTQIKVVKCSGFQ